MKLGLPKWLNDGYYKYIYVYNYPDMVKVNPIICHNTVDGKKKSAPVDRWFFPLFIGIQPSFWWCRISQPSTV